MCEVFNMMEERMSPDFGAEMSDTLCSPESIAEEPRDLSIRQRKMRLIPPPLDLSKRTFEPEPMITEYTPLSSISPRSPFGQKSLPLRKRAHSWSFQNEEDTMPGGAPPPDGTRWGGSVIRISTAVRVESVTTTVHHRSAGSSASSLRIPGLPTPRTPHSPRTHPHSAIPVITSRFSYESSSYIPNHSFSHQMPLNLSTSSGCLPSSLLSPAPSHPSTSSLNSSREELENEAMMGDNNTEGGCWPPRQQVIAMSPRPVIPTTIIERYNCPTPSPVPVSPQPPPWSHHWPTGVWSVFLAGVRVHFVLRGGAVTPARLSEELGQLEHNHQQLYAPHGLHLLRVMHDPPTGGGPSAAPSGYCHLYFRPAGVQQEDVMAVVSTHHPFYVHGKGWCSVNPDHTMQRYNLPCQCLAEGDLCLPPYHPETSVPVVTPDLTDAMKRFDFSDEPIDCNMGSAYSAPPSATLPPHTQRSVFLSPPASPSKKGRDRTTPAPPGTDAQSRPRRPMNGFMLFAKYHRLKLIQQYPGKDNRAISVLLGAMWKSLPETERERFNTEARAQAEERKRIDPDCWKRKRSHSTS